MCCWRCKPCSIINVLLSLLAEHGMYVIARGQQVGRCRTKTPASICSICVKLCGGPCYCTW
jgi:hypothetical protein